MYIRYVYIHIYIYIYTHGILDKTCCTPLYIIRPILLLTSSLQTFPVIIMTNLV